MSKINFTSTRQADSTHRVSDGTEDSYFAWAGGMTGDEIVAAYACGYDFNGGSEYGEVTVYDLEDNSVAFRGEF